MLHPDNYSGELFEAVDGDGTQLWVYGFRDGDVAVATVEYGRVSAGPPHDVCLLSRDQALALAKALTDWSGTRGPS